MDKSKMDVESSTSPLELLLEEKVHYNDLVNSVVSTSESAVDKDGVTLPSGKADSKLQKGWEHQGTQGDRGDPNDPRVRLKRDCVGVLALFRLKDPYCRHLIVANTHIYWDPKWVDVKLAQVKYLLSRLVQFKRIVTRDFACSPSIIVAGDFNSTPGDEVYQYIVSGASAGSLSETDDESPLPLNSLYAYTRGEPQFTNCTPGFTGTLDYILFSPSGDIKPVSYLEIPDSESPDVIGGLPNYYHPSDHLPIGAEFEVLKE